MHVYYWSIRDHPDRSLRFRPLRIDLDLKWSIRWWCQSICKRINALSSLPGVLELLDLILTLREVWVPLRHVVIQFGLSPITFGHKDLLSYGDDLVLEPCRMKVPPSGFDPGKISANAAVAICPDLPRFCQDLPRFVEICRNLLGSPEICWDLPRFGQVLPRFGRD